MALCSRSTARGDGEEVEEEAEEQQHRCEYLISQRGTCQPFTFIFRVFPVIFGPCTWEGNKTLDQP